MKVDEGATGERSTRIFLVGGTGTIGRATARALSARGFDVICFVRDGADLSGLDEATIRVGDPTDRESLRKVGFRDEPFDVVVSCLASRTGEPDDTWAVDYEAHLALLDAAQRVGVTHFILLSAICVQKPRLAFQFAKRAFEERLTASGVDYSIVRPTAYFKSLSGQLDRLRRGKPYLLFGDGSLTACKPISDDDLGAFIADCVNDVDARNRILPIGGPGPALTPREQGEALFAALGQEPKFRSVPPAMLASIAWVLSVLGTIIPPLKAKAELARIGHYYATESMLVWDDVRGVYDADSTPETGTVTLAQFYERLVAGKETVNRAEHAVF